jgi:hypothetical protein
VQFSLQFLQDFIAENGEFKAPQAWLVNKRLRQKKEKRKIVLLGFSPINLATFLQRPHLPKSLPIPTSGGGNP